MQKRKRSLECMGLMKKMLEKEPEKRLPICLVINNSWIKKMGKDQ